MPITAPHEVTPELEKSLQVALEPVAIELRNVLLRRLLSLAPVCEPADKGFRLRADALVEELLADLPVSLNEAVLRSTAASADSHPVVWKEASPRILTTAGSSGL